MLGKDEDGDPIDVAVIAAVAGSAKTTKPVKLTEPEAAALHELSECVADRVEPPPTDPHCPPGSKGVSLDTWRERIRKRSVIGGKDERGKFWRIKTELYRKGRIGIWDDYAWPVSSVTPSQGVT